MWLAAGFLLAAITITGCGQWTPSPSPSPAHHVKVVVRSNGGLMCSVFPYSCAAWLSLLEPDAVVDFVVPPTSNLQWGPGDDDAEGTNVEPALVGVLPEVADGRHLLVVTVTGSYDVVSFDAAGNRAIDLVSRCSSDVTIARETLVMDVVVRFVADGTSFRAACSIEVSQSAVDADAASPS